MLEFHGGETGGERLEQDPEGGFLSSLVVERVELEDSGLYTCRPAAGPQASTEVQVLNRYTEVQAVLGEPGREITL